MNIQDESIWACLNRMSEASIETSSEIAQTSTSWFASSVETSASSIHWTINERGGLAKLAGFAMVPSQIIGPDLEKANQIMDAVIQSPPATLQQIERITIEENGVTIQGIILYPRECDRSKCVVYNNPNAITVAEFFARGFDQDSTPYHIVNKSKCPLIMYDYRGTGISRVKNEESSFPVNVRPSQHTISVDGFTVLKYAMNRFQTADVWGSSLGGGVATVACEEYLKMFPHQAKEIKLFNHDSFTTTGRVVLPSYLQFLAYIVGGNLDADTPMRSLAQRGVKIVVLCHKQDPVIPAGARMAELAETLQGDIKVINSPRYGHANLSNDMLRELRNA